MEGPDLPPPPSGLLRAAAWSGALLLIAAFLVVLATFGAMLRVVVVPMLVAMLGMALLHPLFRLLRRWKLPGWLAAGLTTMVLALGLIVAGYVVVSAMMQHGADIATAVRDGAQQLTEELGLPRDVLENAVEAFRQTSEAMTGRMAEGLVTGVTLAVQVVVGGLLSLVLTFFLLRDGYRLPGLFRSLAPTPYGEQIEHLARTGFRAMSGFMRGVTIVALIDAVFIFIGLLVLGVPGATGLAVLIFLGGYVPFIGAFLSGTVAVLVAFADQGLSVALWVLAVVVVVQQVEGNVLEPIVQSRTVALHPALVLIAITAGGGLAGIVGVLLAIPLTAAVVAILRELRGQDPMRRPDRADPKRRRAEPEPEPEHS
jgi:predicted PurR-regulated permease PerM